MGKVTVTGEVLAGGYTKIVTEEFTRPANTTQYTANDVVSNSATLSRVLVFKNIARFPGGGGVLYSGLMFASTDATTNPNFDLQLYDTSKLTLAADNATGTITDSEVKSLVAVVRFDGTVADNVSTAGANLIIIAPNIGQQFKCAQDSRDLYGVVVDRGGYTPASAENFAFKLAVLQD